MKEDEEIFNLQKMLIMQFNNLTHPFKIWKKNQKELDYFPVGHIIIVSRFSSEIQTDQRTIRSKGWINDDNVVVTNDNEGTVSTELNDSVSVNWLVLTAYSALRAQLYIVPV